MHLALMERIFFKLRLNGQFFRQPKAATGYFGGDIQN
jgi:hypothetical protein